MTRKEAIELLDILPWCNECDSNNFPYTCVECGDAFLLAMEALKQPEIVRCKNCKYSSPDMMCNHPVEWNNGESRNHCNPNWFCADGEKK